MADITTGLLLWAALNEGTGTSPTDSSGQGRTITLSGSTAWVAGKIGPYALDLNGTNGIATITYNAALSTNSQTVALWVNPDTWGGGLNTIFSSQASGSPFAGHDIRNNSGLEFAIVAGGSAFTVRPPADITTGSWQHIAVTYDATTHTLTGYKNGVAGTPNTSPSGNMTTSTANPTIGTNASFPSGRYFDGKVDDFRIYNRALSASEIAALYNWPANVRRRRSLMAAA